MHLSRIAGLSLSCLIPFAVTSSAQQPDPTLFSALRYRMIGPHRGGRTVAAVGVPQQPNLFYIGVNNGGVWKSTDYGRVWTPIFDDQPTGSIGAIAVAPSDPRVIYVGSGEGLQRPDLSTGDGIYKSTDGGASWTHLGLRDGQQISMIIVDPRDPERLFVAVMGHPYGPNEERGIYRSTDGGRSFQKVLYKDENTGGMDLAFDPSNAQTVYADLWEARQAPWENGVFTGRGSGLYKSTDGGTTWRELRQGLPSVDEGLGRIGLDVSRSDSRRLFAIVDAKNGGLYRSDDAGESWRLVNADARLWGRGGDFNEVRIDPKNPDLLYVANVVTWKSTDGGKTFTAFRGAPGGDDYHRLWINPDDPKIILLTADQGALVTVNGGDTWSSWYNQPTAQFYHVSTDSAFPYRVCGGQQESGSACVSSRGDDGQVTFREWHPVGVEEYGYVAADPLDPDLIYGGRLTRYDRRTGEVQNVAPKAIRDKDYRVLRTAPVLFSPLDPRTLYFASNVVWKTTTAGRSWTQISPDLTRRDSVVPPNVGVYASSDAARARHPGVVYTLAPSSKDARRIWAGTDDGLIHVTTDGGAKWRNVTPAQLVPWSKVSLIEASHFDTATAYAAINTFRLDDLRPHIYRTRDGGRSWTEITTGIPDGGIVNAVREDPRRKGLLFAGTERQVYVSFDDGDHWQSLRLNMPASSIRDLVIHHDDLVVATHGRSFWILDDITPLRQIDARTAATDVVLFKPQLATRVRWNKNTDTPLPQEEPAGQNPPDGAIIDYYLRAAAAGPVTIEIMTRPGPGRMPMIVRRFTSEDVPEPPVEGRNIPDYWIRPPQRVSSAAGAHRFVWDLHLAPPKAPHYEYPIAAIYGDTPREPRGPWALPGEYTVRLTAGDQTYTQPLTVRMDPRVKTSLAGLTQQYTLGTVLAEGLGRVTDALAQSKSDATRTATLDRLGGDLQALYDIVQGADLTPTPQVAAEVRAKLRALDAALAGK